MKEPTKDFKFNLFVGITTLITGLLFSLLYTWILPDKIMSIVSVSLGFGVCNFIILVALIRELWKK